ncbi:unnamed protein product [Fusarium venenatum]|uniref:Uncharacterized protein n=1 Tax=Fusarium venenatum TaxID=56646 RepID=A0A2L2TUR1_9HYPO|nr:uncharacterized protein FVRRES_10418 [Fusarium venenatum]CEI70341.1 unnamed protein product [Fusarium venenatum]
MLLCDQMQKFATVTKYTDMNYQAGSFPNTGLLCCLKEPTRDLTVDHVMSMLLDKNGDYGFVPPEGNLNHGIIASADQTNPHGRRAMHVSSLVPDD